MEGGNTMDWLDGFGIFYIIGGVTVLLVFFMSYLLKKRFPDKQFDIIFALSLVLLCLAFFPVTMIAIGGWEGMGYGFICFFVLIGTLIGMVAHQLVKIVRKSYV
ncbi:hypothetical protein COL41_19215 [Bacillus mycoides]|jgi:hypothetical protein|uniref:YesK-like protein n=10 Tax=Bacillus cereus group TaxID=86661 RepID=A9VSK5_BACMK|nr:conserved hypothetical protein [Bacillus mycoides KBAB4]EEK75117.1 hypothetical protein bcere0007_3810 [Bacillus mycoides]EEL08020.1 hypothetical protein bcere0014_3610 [Bacillus cereus BDRD-ST196]EEM01303.1 hypothetical protein bmyco0001_3490 [Bacillus mycoides DSM 2048]ETT87041.1 hypothetical protein C174_00015 [Bacillus mycoides FSL H7-687]PRD08893.1 hypothetical protein CQ058_18490 [Bacillus sp. MYb56]